MSVLLPALGVAFAAFCVWLGVRIINRREWWAKRTAVGLVVALVLYPLSIGPVALLTEKKLLPTFPLLIYWPLVEASQTSEITYDALERYVELWTGPPDVDASVPNI